MSDAPDSSPDPALASDALPSGAATEPEVRRPGEVLFAAFLALFSLALLWEAYGISGLTKLSGAGTVPTATTAVMVVTAVLVLLKTLRLPRAEGQSVRRDVLPGAVLLMMALLAAFAALLVPVGFLPVSAAFLILSIRFLSGRGWVFSVAMGLFSLLIVYLIFRIVFTVLMPPGIVPEGQMLQWFRNLLGGRG